MIGTPERARRARRRRRRARARLRRRAGQRLERARPPGLGVRAARPLPRQVVRDVHCRLGDAARALPRVAAPPQEPEPLPHLRAAERAVFDIDLEVDLNGETISRTSSRNLYWTPEQQIAHLTSNGAALRTGDLLASGTISGDEPGSRGSLIELTWNGAEPLELADGSTRTFLEDGDEVVLRGHSAGFALGEVRGRIEPAA